MNDIAIHDFLYFPDGIRVDHVARFTVRIGPIIIANVKLVRWGIVVRLEFPEGVFVSDRELFEQVRSLAVAEFNQRTMEEA
jgi:hypothetical protein